MDRTQREPLWGPSRQRFIKTNRSPLVVVLALLVGQQGTVAPSPGGRKDVSCEKPQHAPSCPAMACIGTFTDRSLKIIFEPGPTICNERTRPMMMGPFAVSAEIAGRSAVQLLEHQSSRLSTMIPCSSQNLEYHLQMSKAKANEKLISRGESQ
jgi:hypothetical protein